MAELTDVKTGEVIDREDAIALRRPAVPATLNDLAALKGGAMEVIEARVKVLTTMRQAAIRITSPEDWLLFMAPEAQGGQIVGYLQDCGADRVRDIYGIEIFDISQPEKVVGDNANVFHYLIQGSGRCKVTGQVLEAVEGGRSSTDDFCKGKSGVELELAVRKAARANLDGNITRELSGLKNVPLKEIEEAWSGTSKDVARCRKGRGFGTTNERLGANKESAPDVEPPTCTHCGSKGVYREGKNGRPGFYGCPKYQTHADKRWIVDAEKWVAEQQQKAKTSTSTPPQAEPQHTETKRASGAPPSAGDIFGGRGRQPGEEG